MPALLEKLFQKTYKPIYINANTSIIIYSY
jgi:hypothetical protein